MVARLRLLVVLDQAEVSIPVEATPGAPGGHPRHAAVAPDVLPVHGYVEALAQVRREPRRGTVRAVRPPSARIARVLYADALAVVLPVARVPGHVLVAHALGHPARPADDVVSGDVGIRVLEPAYGARVGALRYVDDYRVHGSDAPITVGVVAAVCRPPVRSPVVGAAGPTRRELGRVHPLRRQAQGLPGGDGRGGPTPQNPEDL